MNHLRSGIARDSIFLHIWAAIFLSATATFFLLMTLSAMVFSHTGSAFMANSVVLTQWLPAVLALPLIKVAVARCSERRLLVACELGSAALLPLVALLIAWPKLLIALLLFKGTFDALSKVSRAAAVKVYFSGKALDQAASYYNTAVLVGGGIGALIGALLLHQIALSGSLLLCCGLHLASATLYASLPANTAHETGERHQVQTAPSVPLSDVRAATIYFVAAICLFQGYHNIARSVFPTTQLGMPEASIALIQTITNLAYIVGAIIAARVALVGRRYNSAGPVVHGLALLALVPLPFMSAPLAGVVFYALFGFAFEVAFCVHLRYIITNAPPGQMARIIANANAWGLGLMVGVSLLGSYAADKTGLIAITAVIVAAASAVPLVANFASLRSRAAFDARASRVG